MPPRDATMSLEEFRHFYDKNRRQIRSARAYDAADRRWVEGEDIFREPGVYTLIVVQLRSRDFLRISVRPSLEVSYAPEKYASASTWGSLGIHLTCAEKEFLEGIGGTARSVDELIAAVAGSDFGGKGALVEKLKKAREKMRG